VALCFVVLFPSWALTIHVYSSSKTVPYIHAPLQLLTLIVGLAYGVQLARAAGSITGYHPVIGLVMMSSLMLLQPIMGLLQLIHYRKHQAKGFYAYTHRYLCRTLLTLGIVNGGLRFRFVGLGMPVFDSRPAIAYGVIAGVVGLVYITVATVSIVRWSGGYSSLKDDGVPLLNRRQ
jgi:hypothetical protein